MVVWELVFKVTLEHSLSMVSENIPTIPNVRFGIGVRGGGGIMSIPLLMDELYYQEKIVPSFGATSIVHQGVKPVGMGGLTFEYYTKLSHFSIGLDADFIFVVGVGAGANTNGYFKYTF